MNMDYGQRLKQARKAAGLTLRALAERCSVDFTYISHLEHGRGLPSLALGQAFTAELGADLIPPGEVARLLVRISELEAENGRLREQVQQLLDQHGTSPYLGYKSELKGL